jgi:hypothetical protein
MRTVPDAARHDCAVARELIARDGVCVVARCPCGTIDLTLGALTLRLHEDAFESLSMLLAEATRRLRQAQMKTARRDGPETVS